MAAEARTKRDEHIYSHRLIDHIYLSFIKPKYVLLNRLFCSLCHMVEFLYIQECFSMKLSQPWNFSGCDNSYYIINETDFSVATSFTFLFDILCYWFSTNVCLCSGFHFSPSVFKNWFRWVVWAFTTCWRYMGMGIPYLVFVVWLFCIWSVGYAAIPIIQWLDPFHSHAPSHTSDLLYPGSVSKCHNQLPYSHSDLWGMFPEVFLHPFLFVMVIMDDDKERRCRKS